MLSSSSVSVSAVGPAATTHPSRRSRACVVEGGSSSRWCVVTTSARPGSSLASRVSAARSVSRPGRSRPAPGSSSRRSRGRGTSARAIERPLALSLGAVREPPSRNRRQAERRHQLVRALALAPREPLLEVADRLRGAGVDDLLHREPRRKPVARPRVDEADRLAQAEDVGPAEPPSEDLDGAARRELHGPRNGEQRRLARPIGPEQRPALAWLNDPGELLEDRDAGRARGLPAPYGDAVETQAGG